MGCSNCSSDGGTPRGCKNNGTCSSGGCNKLEVYDWLANIALPNGQSTYDIVEIRFKNSRKSFYRNSKNFSLQVGDVVAVEASPGFDIGVISVVGELARLQVKKKAAGFKPMEAKKIIRIATQEDIDKWAQARSLEKEVMYKSRTLAVNLSLEMKISDVEYQGDLSKATFYYTAEGRVDFRQLIKDMADQFRIRVEMRQIGSRQEASRLGGIGSCGRELCCSTWLTDFRSVSTSAARYQQLSLNPQKLAGQCGKLKCCLNYELDMYLDAIKAFPKSDVRLQTEIGNAYHVKTDVFKRQMWFAYEGNSASGLIAMTPERVREIVRMNREEKKPKELNEYVHVEVKEPDYTNVVGQDSLNRFEHTFKNKKKKKKPNNPNNQNRPVVGENQTGEKQSPRHTPNPRPVQNPKYSPNPRPEGEQKEGETKANISGTSPNPANKKRNNRPNKNRNKENPNPPNTNENKE